MNSFIRENRQSHVKPWEKKSERFLGKGYSVHVGRKFNSDGSFRIFRGGTVISFIPESDPLYAQLLEIQKIYKSSSFGSKFTMLPPSSFHITIFIVFNDEEREHSHWSKFLDSHTAREEVHRFMGTKIPQVEAPKNIILQPSYVDSDTVRLSPFNTEISEQLQNYRDTLSEVTGVRFNDHNHYSYHVTFSYIIEQLTKTEHRELLVLNEICTNMLLQEIKKIHLTQPLYTYFDTMAEFKVY